MRKYRLDKDEQAILNSVESGKWVSTKPSKAELERYAQIARNTLKKDQRMNIRISRMDLHGIKARAAQEGIPYQTLVASIIHKYISGSLAAA